MPETSAHAVVAGACLVDFPRSLPAPKRPPREPQEGPRRPIIPTETRDQGRVDGGPLEEVEPEQQGASLAGALRRGRFPTFQGRAGGVPAAFHLVMEDTAPKSGLEPRREVLVVASQGTAAARSAGLQAEEGLPYQGPVHCPSEAGIWGPKRRSTSPKGSLRASGKRARKSTTRAGRRPGLRSPARAERAEFLRAACQPPLPSAPASWLALASGPREEAPPRA